METVPFGMLWKGIDGDTKDRVDNLISNSLWILNFPFDCMEQVNNT
jgi:hypothetical protein